MKENKRSYLRKEQRKKQGCAGHFSLYGETEIRVAFVPHGDYAVQLRMFSCCFSNVGLSFLF